MKELAFSDSWYIFLLIGIACYFIGCFNSAILISNLKKRDVRTIGSGNPGTMNMFREFGWGIAVLTFFSDVFKGGIPAVISYFIFKNYVFAGTEVIVLDFTRYFCGLCVIIGHIYPVTLKFKGGKGIASTFGLFWICLACESLWWLLICFLMLVCVLTYILTTHWGSMGSLMGVTAFSLCQGVIFYFRYINCLTNVWVLIIVAMLFALNFLTWFAHRENIVRLLSGEEHLTAAKKKNKAKSV